MGFDRGVIESIKAQVDLGDLIGRFVKLQRNGANLKGLCPFHNENTPSFNVTPTKGIYKCFGCAKSGDHISFIQEHESLSFIEAVHWIAREYGIELPEKEVQKARRPHYEKRKSSENEKPGSYWFDFQEMEDDDLRIWFGSNIIKEHKNNPEHLFKVLDELGWQKVKSWYTAYDDGNTAIKTANENYPIYARTEMWDLFGKTGEFTKIYQPFHFDKGKKFSYQGELPKEFVNGLRQAVKAQQDKENDAMLEAAENGDDSETSEDKYKLDEVLICSGERDAANARAMGFWPVWLNSETAKLSPAVLTRLFQIAKNVVNVPDIDTTGLERMHALSMCEDSERFLEIRNLILPMELRNKYSNGKPCKDLRDYLNHWTRWDFNRLLNTAMPYKFWDYIVTEFKGRISSRYEIDNEALVNFLERNGFYQYQITPEGIEVPQTRLIQIEKRVVKFVTESQIKSWVINFLRERNYPIKLRNAAHRTAYFGAKYMDGLRWLSPDFKAHDKDFQLLFFRNKVWRITAEGIQDIPSANDSLKKYVWGDKMIPHHVEVAKTAPFEISYTKEDGFDIVIHDTESLFMKYLIASSAIHWKVEEFGIEEEVDGKTVVRKELTDTEKKEQRLNLINKLFAIGYLSHRQKYKFRPWFVYGMENKVTGEGKSKGGTGKSAFFDAFRSYMRVVTVSGGRETSEDKHKWGAVTKDTDMVYIDDMHEFFNWRDIYPHTTDNFPVNPKNMAGFTIPFQDSPKMCGSGNFAVRDNEDSTIRRILFVTFSDFFHSANPQEGLEERTIKDYLGRELYLDFAAKDWNEFYNVIAHCIKFYMWNPSGRKVDPPMTDVIYKNIRGSIGETFYDWAEKIFTPELQNTDVLLIREQLQEHYAETLKKRNLFKANPSPQLFKEKLEKFCYLMKWSLNPPAHPSMQKPKPGSRTSPRIQKWVPADGRPREMFYIQTPDEKGNPRPLNNEDIKIDLDKPMASAPGLNDDLPY